MSYSGSSPVRWRGNENCRYITSSDEEGAEPQQQTVELFCLFNNKIIFKQNSPQNYPGRGRYFMLQNTQYSTGVFRGHFGLSWSVCLSCDLLLLLNVNWSVETGAG